MDELIDKRVEKIEISQDKTEILFHTEGGQIIWYTAVGDCCSTSWIEHVTGYETIRGQIVRSFTQIELPHPEDEDEPDRYEVITVYGYRLTTDRGLFEIELRNESNGYYDGYFMLNEGRYIPESDNPLSELKDF